MPCPGNPKATHAAPEKSPAGFGQRVDAMYPRVTRGNSLRPYFRELRFVERSLLSIDTGNPLFHLTISFKSSTSLKPKAGFFTDQQERIVKPVFWEPLDSKWVLRHWALLMVETAIRCKGPVVIAGKPAEDVKCSWDYKIYWSKLIRAVHSIRPLFPSECAAPTCKNGCW